jgi:hypothetical protein
MHMDDALEFIIDHLKISGKMRTNYFGYEVNLHGIILEHLRESDPANAHIQNVRDHPRNRELSIAFFEAAWELCRRGVLRPSVQFMGGEGSPDGTGYSLTAQGRRWIEAGAPPVLLGGPERISQLFTKLSIQLGPAFLQRGTEAAHCHAFGVYVACCAMCGAAAESILLAVAIAKNKDEERVLALYRSAQGRRDVINSVTGQARQSIAAPFRSAMGLLSYWRDDAAHGLASSISEIEAHEALARLLRFAQFATDNWNELTQP